MRGPIHHQNREREGAERSRSAPSELEELPEEERALILANLGRLTKPFEPPLDEVGETEVVDTLERGTSANAA